MWGTRQFGYLKCRLQLKIQANRVGAWQSKLIATSPLHALYINTLITNCTTNPPEPLCCILLYLSWPDKVDMSTLEDLDDLEQERKEEKKDGDKDGDKKKPTQNGDAEMKDAEEEQPEEEDPIFDEIETFGTQDIISRRRLLENDSRIMKSEFQRLSHEKATMNEKIKDNLEKIENNRSVSSWYDRWRLTNCWLDNFLISLETSSNS